MFTRPSDLHVVRMTLILCLSSVGCATGSVTRTVWQNPVDGQANQLSLVNCSDRTNSLPLRSLLPPSAGGCERRPTAAVNTRVPQTRPSQPADMTLPSDAGSSTSARRATAGRTASMPSVIQAAAWFDDVESTPRGPQSNLPGAGCEPSAAGQGGTIPAVPNEQLLKLTERLSSLEAELMQSRSELQSVKSELVTAQNEVAQLSNEVSQWQTEFQRLEQTMLEHHEADILTLTQLADSLSLLADSASTVPESAP